MSSDVYMNQVVNVTNKTKTNKIKKDKRNTTSFDFKTGYKVARVFLKCAYTNLFVSVVDKNNKFLICRSSGSSGIKGNKRRKEAPQAIEKIMSKIYPTMKLNKIRKVIIIIKDRVNARAYYLIKEILFFSIIIFGFEHRKLVAHNGTRSRKLKRS